MASFGIKTSSFFFPRCTLAACAASEIGKKKSTYHQWLQDRADLRTKSKRIHHTYRMRIPTVSLRGSIITKFHSFHQRFRSPTVLTNLSFHSPTQGSKPAGFPCNKKFPQRQRRRSCNLKLTSLADIKNHAEKQPSRRKATFILPVKRPIAPSCWFSISTRRPAAHRPSGTCHRGV